MPHSTVMDAAGRSMGSGTMRLWAGLAIALCMSGAANAQSDLMSAAFAPQTRADDPIGSILDHREEYRGGPIRWTTSRVPLKPMAKGAVDSIRLSVGGPVRSPGAAALDFDRAEFDADSYEVSLIRDWPSAVRFEAGDYDLDVTPHAGFGVSNAGGQAEAGARLTFGQRAEEAVQERLRGLGVTDGASFGNQGRWYLFAAASGRAVGLNLLRSNGDWNRAGWTTDPASRIVGDAQVGVGWRKGALESSFGYIHREVKSERMLLGQEGRDDSMVAFSLSIKPGR